MFYICKIIAPNQEDKDILSRFLGKYPLDVLDEYLDDNLDDTPKLIIGWQNVKKYFPDQNILDKDIKENVSWAYGKFEDEDKLYLHVDEFINNSIKKWLPSDFILYDSMFAKVDLLSFSRAEIEENTDCYVFFGDGAIYINQKEKNFIINLKSLWAADVNYKDLVTDFLNENKCKFFSYKNISPHVNLDRLKKVITLENVRWVKYGQGTPNKYLQIIPGFGMDKYAPFIMSKVFNFNFTQEEKVAIKRMCERDVITEWLSNRYICFDDKLKSGGLNFIYRGNAKLAKVNFSNKRTLTGRIVSEDSYNPQNLAKSNNERRDIVSRFDGGKIIVFDYTSFESRIALYFCENDNFIRQNYEKDLHFEVAKLIFLTTYISEEQREFSKIINHSIMYGASKNTILEKLKNFNNSEKIYDDIRRFLRPIMKQSYEIKKFNEENGYIINKWGTIIKPKSSKDYASFNNYIQSTATEILVDKLFEVKSFIKNYKSEFIFQVHDSLIFDICKEEKIIVKDLVKILTQYKDMKFSISYRSGVNYKDLTKEYHFFG